MKKLITGSVLAAVLAIGGIQIGAPASAEAKTTKQGFVHNGHCIAVSVNAIPAHKAHGDEECKLPDPGPSK